MKIEALEEELEAAILGSTSSWKIKNLKVKLLEAENFLESESDGFIKNDEEIQILEKLLAEAFEIAEPTRLQGYSDEEMWEANQANEYTVKVAKDMQAEMIANGRPSAMLIRQAMSNPQTWEAVKEIGLVPEDCELIAGNNDPQKIQLSLPGQPKPENSLCMQN